MSVVVVGGGWAGCAAASAAAYAGANVVILEKTDMLGNRSCGRDHAQQRPADCWKRPVVGAVNSSG